MAAVKAITLKQPLPWLIFDYNLRDPMRVINWSEEISHRGMLWIHAGDIDDAIVEYVEKTMKIHIPRPNKFQPVRLKTNGYYGFVTVTDCRRGVNSRWSSSAKWNIVIKDPLKMPFVAHPGGVGLFDYTEAQ